MATYVIGDLQGCFDPLQRLLQQINFSSEDTLWFCGDLIARGPDSLSCLQFIYELGSQARCVLGNHDLHFLASYYGFSQLKAEDKLQQLIKAQHLPQLVDWLQQQPLIHISDNQQHIMVHAGLAPEWDINTALIAAAEVSHLIQHQPEQIFAIMYGNSPANWINAATDTEKWRFTINACTRMRFCRQDGSLEFKEKGSPLQQNALVPWYEFWQHKAHPALYFGHWAALNGYSPIANIHALDTGCVWGNTLTAYCIETAKRYSVTGLQN